MTLYELKLIINDHNKWLLIIFVFCCQECAAAGGVCDDDDIGRTSKLNYKDSLSYHPILL